jgi:hypothetical protein
MTMLRDPVARYVSQYAFWRAPSVLGSAMARAGNASLEACADSADSGAARYGCPPANYATRYLCGHGPPCADPPDEASFAQARPACGPCSLLGIGTTTPHTRLLPLQAAAHLREAYAFVGVVERMETSLWVLSRKMPSWFAAPSAAGDPGGVGAADVHAARLNRARGGTGADAQRQLTPVRHAVMTYHASCDELTHAHPIHRL